MHVLSAKKFNEVLVVQAGLLKGHTSRSFVTDGAELHFVPAPGTAADLQVSILASLQTAPFLPH